MFFSPFTCNVKYFIFTSVYASQDKMGNRYVYRVALLDSANQLQKCIQSLNYLSICRCQLFYNFPLRLDLCLFVESFTNFSRIYAVVSFFTLRIISCDVICVAWQTNDSFLAELIECSSFKSLKKPPMNVTDQCIRHHFESVPSHRLTNQASLTECLKELVSIQTTHSNAMSFQGVHQHTNSVQAIILKTMLSANENRVH